MRPGVTPNRRKTSRPPAPDRFRTFRNSRPACLKLSSGHVWSRDNSTAPPPFAAHARPRWLRVLRPKPCMDPIQTVYGSERNRARIRSDPCMDRIETVHGSDPIRVWIGSKPCMDQIGSMHGSDRNRVWIRSDPCMDRIATVYGSDQIHVWIGSDPCMDQIETVHGFPLLLACHGRAGPGRRPRSPPWERRHPAGVFLCARGIAPARMPALPEHPPKPH